MIRCFGGNAYDIEYPPEALCAWCDEPINPPDPGVQIDSLDDDERSVLNFHVACHLRQVIGSVAHIEKRCCCYIPGSLESDPPGMTRREAAIAARNALIRKGFKDADG